MRNTFILAVATFTISASALLAQVPGQLIVQSAAPAPVATTTVPAAAPASNAAASAALLQSLQQLKAANDELLKRQAATLGQLEEMEKAADQIKVFSKRS